eukprot:768450-Hanusia_phi.AAC.2
MFLVISVIEVRRRRRRRRRRRSRRSQGVAGQGAGEAGSVEDRSRGSLVEDGEERVHPWWIRGRERRRKECVLQRVSSRRRSRIRKDKGSIVKETRAVMVALILVVVVKAQNQFIIRSRHCFPPSPKDEERLVQIGRIRTGGLEKETPILGG